MSDDERDQVEKILDKVKRMVSNDGKSSADTVSMDDDGEVSRTNWKAAQVAIYHLNAVCSQVNARSKSAMADVATLRDKVRAWRTETDVDVDLLIDWKDTGRYFRVAIFLLVVERASCWAVWLVVTINDYYNR
jgi:hypothetical protein